MNLTNCRHIPVFFIPDGAGQQNLSIFLDCHAICHIFPIAVIIACHSICSEGRIKHPLIGQLQ